MFVLLKLVLLYIKKGLDGFWIFTIELRLLVLENGTIALLVVVLVLEKGTNALFVIVLVLESGANWLNVSSSSLMVNKDDWLFNPKLLLKRVEEDEGNELKFDEEESENGVNRVDDEFFPFETKFEFELSIDSKKSTFSILYLI